VATGVQTEDSIRWELCGAIMPDGPSRFSSPPISSKVDEHMLMPGNRNHVLDILSGAG